MVVLGGLGNMWGAFVGATILTVTPELLRTVADLRLLIYGAVLVLMMRVRPQGLLGQSRNDDSPPAIERLYRQLRARF
jgi:branched-chain amino acid transport system permease protein